MNIGADRNTNPSLPPDVDAIDRGPAATIRRLTVAGIAMIAVFVGGFGGWATTSELAGAVIASGTVIVESVDKKVQHPTGGVVKEILTFQGEVVNSGDVLLVIDKNG